MARVEWLNRCGGHAVNGKPVKYLTKEFTLKTVWFLYALPGIFRYKERLRSSPPAAPMPAKIGA